MIPHELLAHFGSRVVTQSGEAFLRLDDALQLVAGCRSLQLAVIGIEGFVMSPPAVYPDLDRIADFSDSGAGTWRAYADACNDAAEQFLREIAPKRRDTDFVVSLTVLSEQDWEPEPIV